MEISAISCMDLWKSALRFVYEKGETYDDSRNRVCYETEGLLLHLVSSAKIAEPVKWLSKQPDWLYPDPNEITQVIFDKKNAANYSYSYANRIFGKINQLDDFVIPLLRKKPTSRRAIVTIGDVEKDVSPKYTEMPGMLYVDFKLRNEKLNISVAIRSCDIFVGFPANMYQIHAIQQYVASRLGVEEGHIRLFCTSAHIFDDQFTHIKKLIKEK